MTVPYLPDEILSNIIKRIGDEDFELLKPFLTSGKRSNELVFGGDILASANIYKLGYEPSLFMEEVGGVSAEGRGRRFFLKCLAKGNPIAIYYEGLRIAMRRNDLSSAISMIKNNVPSCPYSTLAVAMFFTMLGDADEAVPYFLSLFNKHAQQGSAKLRDLCEEFKWDLEQFEPPYLCNYSWFFRYPNCEAIRIPDCALEHDAVSVKACDDCHLYWTANNICHML